MEEILQGDQDSTDGHTGQDIHSETSSDNAEPGIYVAVILNNAHLLLYLRSK